MFSVFMKKEQINQRSISLYGNENIKKLENLKVAVIGLGGVGSIVPISLVRSNVKNLILIDKDKVEISNLNRQLAYDLDDLDKYKADVLKEKLEKMNFDLNIKNYNLKIEASFDLNILKDVDYIIDCIDDIKAKIVLIKFALEHNIKIITSLGMGKRFLLKDVIIDKLNKSFNDKLGRKLRYELKKEGVDIPKVYCAFSLETIKEELNDKDVIASSFFNPNLAGLKIGAFVINDYLDIK